MTGKNISKVEQCRQEMQDYLERHEYLPVDDFELKEEFKGKYRPNTIRAALDRLKDASGITDATSLGQSDSCRFVYAPDPEKLPEAVVEVSPSGIYFEYNFLGEQECD